MNTIDYISDLEKDMILKVSKSFRGLAKGDIIQIKDFDDELDKDGEFRIQWKLLYSEENEIGGYDYDYFCDEENKYSTRPIISRVFIVME